MFSLNIPGTKEKAYFPNKKEQAVLHFLLCMDEKICYAIIN
jgi:hypothetical protein